MAASRAHSGPRCFTQYLGKIIVSEKMFSVGSPQCPFSNINPWSFVASQPPLTHEEIEAMRDQEHLGP